MRFQELLDTVAKPIPAYRRSIFKTIIIGLLVRNGNGRISAIFRQFAGLFEGTCITRKRFYTFLNSRKIPWQALWQCACGLLQDSVTVAGRLLVVLDDTTYGKTGKKIRGCDIHFDHAAKTNSSRWIYGHCRVLSGLLIKCHGRWACLPFGQKNFQPQKHKDKSKRRDWHTTKNGIAAVLVDAIRRRFQLPTLVIADSWFGNYPLLRELREQAGLPKVDMLSRLRISCALYDMPKAKKKRTRGRPRKYGRRLPTVKVLAKNLRDQAQTQTMFIYGRNRECTYAELICMSKAWKCQVKVVFVYRKNGTVFPLITTDRKLTAPQMIEYYAARWKIESGFKELKHEIGALDSQCRNQQSVENHFDLCCLSMTIGWIYALHQDSAPKRRRPGQRSGAFAFADVRRAIAAELRNTPIFHNRCSKTVKRAIKLLRDTLFSPAA
jgi:IS4 transposase